MRQVLDRLQEALTEIDNAIRRQRQALATVGAVENLSHLEYARGCIHNAQIVLTRFRADDVLPTESAPSLQTPDSPPGESQP